MYHTGRKGGANGDLYIQLNVQKDPIFRREGQDIYTIEEISYIQAILGTTIQAHTIDGKLLYVSFLLSRVKLSEDQEAEVVF